MSFTENIIFWSITISVPFALGFLLKCYIRYKAIREGLRAILRDRILTSYKHYEKKGFAPIYAVENVENMYKAYHDLGGNGTVTSIYNDFKKLPHFPKEE